MAAAADYEAQRRRQIEENKRRIEELGLRHLAAATMPPKVPKAKQLKLKHNARAPGAAAPPRWSGRVANLPDHPDYRENVKKKIIGPTAAERRYAIAKAEAKAKAKAEAEAMAKAEAEAEAKAEAKAKAEAEAKELEGELSADYPTFLKTMSQRSPTAFSLTLPPLFCREHLSENVGVITLVDEEDDEFDMPYYKEPNGHYRCRINRWKGFAMDHELDDGDCLVFQLIQQRKFKVYIIRARSYLKMMS